jgi:glycosyltransferase involved in cell wall biosynthesis
MNLPSHYQSAFFRALDARDEVDLKVCYLCGASRERAEEGWNGAPVYEGYECGVEGISDPLDMVRNVPDWRERIHVICSHFSPGLIQLFCASSVAWCHWSEMSGIHLAEVLDYRVGLFRLLNPLMFACKRREGRIIRKNALGAWGQGVLARRALGRMGVPRGMISDLYYAPEAVPEQEPSRQILDFAAGRRVFLAVGILCRRKGSDLILKALADVKAEDWCLVFCGLDRSDGACQALAGRLGISDQVLFLGACPAERIGAVYAAADVFVLPSRFDGWGAVLNEAASVGLPLIGSDLCGASWHLIADGENGFRIRAGSVRKWVGAMRFYIENPAQIRVHGAASKQRFFAEFTPEKNAERLVCALKEWSDG